MKMHLVEVWFQATPVWCSGSNRSWSGFRLPTEYWTLCFFPHENQTMNERLSRNYAHNFSHFAVDDPMWATATSPTKYKYKCGLPDMYIHPRTAIPYNAAKTTKSALKSTPSGLPLNGVCSFGKCFPPHFLHRHHSHHSDWNLSLGFFAQSQCTTLNVGPRTTSFAMFSTSPH